MYRKCRHSVSLSELMRKKSLRCWLVYLKSCQSYTLPLTLQQQQLRSQHPLAPVPEGSSASLIISASLIAPLSISLHLQCTPLHPSFLHWLAALWFPNSFVSYFIDHLTHWSECLYGKLHLQWCCTPFKKRMTLPHLPASKGCSFSRPMKVMLYSGE